MITHPDSSVSEIGQRTGFVQSHVSTSVARLKKRGLITTASDPADRRRTRARISGTAMNAITRRAVRRIDDTLGRSVADPIRAERVTVLLDELARLLLR